MLGGLSYYCSRARVTIFSLKQICCPRKSVQQNDVVENLCSHSLTFPLPVIQRRVWILAILLLTLIFPVVIGADRSCLSEYWCVSTGSDNPCSLYSSQTAAISQLCSCVSYNFTLCLNNVSASNIFIKRLKSR